MRRFVAILYENSTAITLDIKSEFGLKARVLPAFQLKQSDLIGIF